MPQVITGIQGGSEEERKGDFLEVPSDKELKLYKLNPGDVSLTKDNLLAEAYSQIENIVQQVINTSTIVQNTIINTVVESGDIGGGSPGGLNTYVQFNDALAFGGVASFTFNKATYTIQLGVEGDTSIIQAPTATTADTNGGSLTLLSGVGIGSGASGTISLIGADTAGSSDAGYIAIAAGSATVDGFAGGVTMGAGSASITEATNPGGNVYIFAGNSGAFQFNPETFDAYYDGLGDGGSITLEAGQTGEGTGGSITLAAGRSHTEVGGNIVLSFPQGDSGQHGYFHVKTFDAFGSIQTNISFGNTPSFGDGQGVIFIANRTTAPSGTPSGGGVLYVASGALTWKGSGGTVTTIAPA